MKFSVVTSNNEEEILRADDWVVGQDGLKFYRDNTCIAWFTNWSYFVMIDEQEK